MAPAFSTPRSFSRRIMLAVSLAMSVPVSTEMLTSAFFMATTSLIPSPMTPTVCPFALRACTTLDLSSGLRRAKMLVVSTATLSSSSDMSSICGPTRMFSVGMPICSQTCLDTYSLSPVRTLTVIPYSFMSSIACLAVGLTGSVKTRNPAMMRSVSSASENSVFPDGMYLCVIPSTRIPFMLYHSTSPIMSLTVFSSRGWMSLFWSRYPVEMERISGMAPLEIMMLTSSSCLTMTVALLLTKSNGTSPMYSNCSTSSRSPSSSSAYSSRAQSIWFVADFRLWALRQESSSTEWLGFP